MKIDEKYVNIYRKIVLRKRNINNSERSAVGPLIIAVFMVSINLLPFSLFYGTVTGDNGTLDGSLTDMLVQGNPPFNRTTEIVAVAEASGGCLGNTTFRLLVDGNLTKSRVMPFVPDNAKKTDSTFNILLKNGRIESAGNGKGCLNSTKISLPSGGSWDVLELNRSVAGGNITVNIYDGDSGSPISGYQGLAGSIIDISGIDNTTHSSIKLKAVFNSSEPGGAALDYWCVRWTGAPGAWGDYFTGETTVSFNWRPMKSGDTNITVQLVSPDDGIDSNNNITRFVTVQEVPEFEIYPARLSVSMEKNETIKKTLYLKNNGKSSLNWSLGKKVKSSVRVAILNYGAEPSYFTGTNSNLYQDYSDALASDDRITRNVVTSLDSGVISGYDTIILPDNGVPDSDLDEVEDWFVPGKTIICVSSAVCYAGYSGLMWPDSEGSNGENAYWEYDSDTNDQKVVLEHRITGDYDLGDILASGNGLATMYGDKLEPDTVVFTESNGDSTRKYIAGRNVEGGGSIFVLGPMQSIDLTKFYPLIRETCFGLEGSSSLPGWLDSSATNGTIEPGEEIELELTFNSTGMDPGIYESTIQFEIDNGSGSGSGTMENLTIEFEVLRPPHDIAVEEILAPAHPEAGKSVNIKAVVTNCGRSDERDIGVNLTIDGKLIASKTVSFLQETPHKIDRCENVILENGDAVLPAEEVLFEDSFPTGSLDTAKWPGSTYSGMNSGTYHSSPYSCDLDSAEHIDSKTMDLSGYSPGHIDFYYRRSGLDSGEYLKLYYYSDSSSWVEIWNVEGFASTDSSFTFVDAALPAGAFHENFKFKFQLTGGGSSIDDVFIDDVELEVSRAVHDGYIVSENITLPAYASWESLNLSRNGAADSWVNISVLYENGTAIPGFGNLTLTDIDLSTLENVSTIKLRGDFSFISGGICALREWRVSWDSPFGGGEWIDSFSNSVEVEFDWTPATAGDYFVEVCAAPVDGENTTYNNLLNATITVTAEPDIWINPSEFNITIKQGEVKEVNLTIGNDGLTDLEWDIMGKPLFKDDFEDGDYDGWNEGSGSYTREVTDQTAANGSKFSLTLIGGSTSQYNGVYHTLPNIQPNYIGFYVRSSSTSKHDAMFIIGNDNTSSGKYIIFFYARDNGRFSINSDNSVTYAINTWYHIEFKDINWTDRTLDYYVDDNLIASDLAFINSGVTDLTQLHLYNYHDSQAWWDEINIGSGYDLREDWLNFSSSSGTINPGNNTTVTVKLNASRLDPGFYQTNITITSNDPDEGMITIPVNLTVSRVDHEIKVANFSAPGTGEAGKSIQVNATILNQGLTNETNITIQLKVDDKVKDNLTISRLDSGNMTDITLNWTPSIAGDYLVEIYVIPVSGEDITYNNALNATINVTAEPDIWIAPVEFNISISQGEVNDTNLTIGNNGLADLDYEIFDSGVSHALSFNGVDDYVALPDENGSWLPVKNFSVSVWAWFNADPSDHEIIFDANFADSSTSSRETGFVLRRTVDGYIQFSLTLVGSPDEQLTYTREISIQEWHHYVVVRENTDQILYIDGYEVTRRTCANSDIDWNGDTIYDDDSVNIGRHKDNYHGSRYHLNGKVDELRILNRAMTPGEVLGDYKALGHYPSRSDTLAWWHFDENEGDMAYDSSGNHNDGQIFGATWTEGVGVTEDVGWLSISPGNGSIDPLDQTNVSVITNTSLLDPGFYQTNLIIYCNDLNEGTLMIPINLTVNPVDHEIKVANFSAPETGEAGKSIRINATILNQGICNETNITIQLKVDDKVKDNLTISRLDSGNMTDITLNWTPPIAGEYLVEVHAAPVGGENQTYNNALNATITVTAEPDIWFDPSEFNATIRQGEVTDLNLTLGNDGLADLDYEIITGEDPYALNFDGNDYIELTTDSSLPAGTSDRTIEVWVKVNAFNAGRIFSYGSWNEDQAYDLIVSSQHKFLIVGHTNNYYTTKDDFSTGTWYHIAAVLEGGNLTFYYNGIYDSIQSTTINTVLSGSAYIGSGVGDPQYFNGIIDEVRILDRALTGEEVLEDYQAGGHYPHRSGTVAWWHFDENSSNIAHDYSINNNNNGTIHGATWIEGVEASGGEVGLISISPVSGTINPWNNTTVTVGLNASRLDPGYYQTDFTILSNDPNEDAKIIPISLTVNPVDHEIKVTNISTPETGEAGKSILINATILNQGISNEINITIQLKVDGKVENNTTISGLDSGKITNITLNWTPPIAGDYIVEVYSVPVSGENITFNNALNTTIIITAEPDIRVNPTRFNITVRQGEVVDINLTIGNDGLGDLEFAISLGQEEIFEDFASTTLNTSRWGSTSGTPQINNKAHNDPSSPYSLDLNGNSDIVESVVFDLTSSTEGEISFYYELGGSGEKPDPGDYLYLEYFDSSSTWQYMWRVEGTGTNNNTFDHAVVRLPADAFHSGFRFRFRAAGGSGTSDDFFIDDMYFNASASNSETLTLSNTSGTIEPFNDTQINMTLNATQFDPGLYQINITISSNDPDEGTLVIPINLTVLPPDHDIEISDLEASWYATYREGAEIKATIQNNGQNDETDIRINLTVDGETSQTEVIPHLQSEEHKIETFMNASLHNGNVGFFKEERIILFEDTFPTSALDTTKWPGSQYSGMSSANYHSSPYGCDLDSSDHIDSMTMDLSGYTAGYISFYYKRSWLDSNEYMRLYYYSESSNWIEIWNVRGHGSSDIFFIPVNESLPESAFHEGFKFKFGLTGGASSSDDIFLDDVIMGAVVQPGNIKIKLLFEDSFPTSSLNPTKWPGSQYSGMSSSYYHSSPYGCDLDSSEHLDSMTINLTDYTAGYVCFYYRRAGIDNGEYLRLYYFSTTSSWIEIWNVNGGPSDSSFLFANVSLPGGAYHDDFKFKFELTGGGSSSDDVYIDDVKMGAVKIPQKGYVISKPITLPDGFSWESLNLSKDVGNGSLMKISVLYENGTVIPGFENLAGSDINLSALTGKSVIRLKAYFVTTGNYSILHGWRVVCCNSSDANDTGSWEDTFSNKLTIIFHWFPEREGWLNVAVEAAPQPGESLLRNNEVNMTVWSFRCNGTILVDYGHDSYAAYGGYGLYDDFQKELFLAGYVVEITTKTITKELLENYTVFLSIGTLLDYSEAEITAIREFVAGGGGFMLLGGRNNWGHYNLLTNNANITWQSPGGSSGITDKIYTHEITEGISSLYCQDPADSLSVSEQAVACVHERNGNYIQVAASEYGLGKIVALQDEYWFSNNRLDDEDNLKFGLNIIQWLARGMKVSADRDFVLLNASESVNLNITIETLVKGGTINLTITGLESGWSGVFDNASFVIDSGEIKIVNFTLTAPSDLSHPDNITAVISAVLNDWEFNCTIEIIARMPPGCEVSPDSIHVRLEANTTYETIISILNTGDGDLDWTIDLPGGKVQGDILILAWTAYADMGGNGEYVHTINAIDQYFTDYDLSETTTTDADTLRTALEGKNVLLIPEQEGASDLRSIGENFADVLRDFVERGGTIVSCGALGTGKNTALLDGSGLVELQYHGSQGSGTSTVITAVHPVTKYLGTTIQNTDGFYYCEEATDMDILVQYGTYPAVLAREIGFGHVVYIPYDFYGYNDDAARLISNAVQWVNPGPIFNLTLAPLNGTLNATPDHDAVQNITLRLDSTNLSLGRYHVNISIHTNDPFIETIIVPVILDIVRGHDIIVEEIIAEPVLSTAYNNSVGAVIRNFGSYNESGVMVRFLVDNEEMSNITILELASGALETLNFDFIPTEGDHTIKITVDPVPYENYTINNQLTHEFEGVPTPVFAIDPDPGVFHVVEGGLYHFNITVRNRGNANLTWFVTDTDEFLSLTPDHGSLQPDGSMDIIITVNATMLVPGEGSYDITFSTNELQGIHVLTIKINVTANTPPVFIMDFPDLTLYIDDRAHIIDLSNSTFDNETPDSVFFEISGWDFYVVNVTLTVGDLVSIYPKWMEGETSLTLRVFDGHGGTDERVFNISVLYNRSPRLDHGVTFELPDDRTSSVNLLDHVEDEKPEELCWELQYGGTALDLSFNGLFNGPLLMVTPENRNTNYSDYVVITVYDLHGKKDITPFNISIIDVNRPPVILPGIEPITIRDDVSNFASVDLGTHGYDPEGDSLYWEIEYDADFFTAVIQGDTLKIMQKEYGSGTADITIILRDPEGKFDSQNISVTIIHLNLKPVLVSGLPFNETLVNQMMKFNIIVEDIDGEVVKNEWDFDGDGIMDWNSTSTQNANFAYSSPGDYTATIFVTDDTGETSTFEFKVKVEEKDKDTSEKDSLFALVLVLSMVVIVLLGLIIGLIKFPGTMKSIFGPASDKKDKKDDKDKKNKIEETESTSVPKKPGLRKFPVADTRPEPGFSDTSFGPKSLKDKPIKKDASLSTDRSEESMGIGTERPPPAQEEREWMPPASGIFKSRVDKDDDIPDCPDLPQGSENQVLSGTPTDITGFEDNEIVVEDKTEVVSGWVCPVCFTHNMDEHSLCNNCGSKKTEKE